MAVLAALVAQAIGGPPVALPPSNAPVSSNFLTHFNFDLPSVLGTLRAYHDAVQLYRRGDADHAMAAVRQLPSDQLEFVIETLRDKGRIPSTNPEHVEYLPFNWTRDDLAAAGMLHGDLAIAAVHTNRFEAPLRLALSVLPLADAARPDMTARPAFWTRDWLRAVANMLLAHGDWKDLGTLLTYVKILFPDDGPLLLARGTVLELASEGAAPPVALTYSGGFAAARRDRDGAEKGAVDALTRAVRFMPEASEPAVRLAHVYVRTHHDDRAIPLVDRVLKGTPDRWWYVAALLRGGINERAGRADAAEQLYRSIIDRFPNAQSPYMALAMLQFSAGRRDDSLATLDRMYARPPSDTDDPWWQYATGMWADANAALQRLRAAVRQ